MLDCSLDERETQVAEKFLAHGLGSDLGILAKILSEHVKDPSKAIRKQLFRPFQMHVRQDCNRALGSPLRCLVFLPSKNTPTGVCF